MTESFTIGLVQMRCGPRPEENMDAAIRQIRSSAQAGVNLVCLPELFLTPYFCQTHDMALFDLAEPIPGPCTEKLAVVARETGVVIIASLFECRMAGIYHNTAVVLDSDGTLLGIYRKMHIPHDPLYFEKYYFRPGDLGFKVFDTKAGRVGTLVCWDQWFPEAARLTALKGAEVIVYPTAIGWHPREKAEYGKAQYDAWQTIQRSHAIANGVFVAACNRVGFEESPNGGIEFWGGSFVADPFGVVLHQASHEKEELAIVKCDRSRVEDVRRNWPFLRDRRTDCYDGITKVADDNGAL